MENILTDVEKAKIELFNEDKILSEAVQKVLLYTIRYAEQIKQGLPILIDKHWVYSIIQSNPSGTDEQIGHELKVKLAADSLLELAVQTLSKIKVNKPTEEVIKNNAI